MQEDFRFSTLVLRHNSFVAPIAMNNLTIFFFAFLFCRLNSNPVPRDTLIESTLGKQFNRRSIDDQACRDLVVIGCQCQQKDKPSDFYEKCLSDAFTYYCGARFLIRELVVDMETNFFENSGMALDMDTV